MNLEIRPEQAGDEEAIDSVVQEAFRLAPHSSGTEQAIVRRLRAAGALFVSLVAVVDGEVVGHVAVSPVRVSDGSTGWFGLGPVAVLPPLQGVGIGARLIRPALDRLRDASAAGCVVLGEPAYYERFGFRSKADLVLDGVPQGYFQALAFGTRLARGAVHYPLAFGAA